MKSMISIVDKCMFCNAKRPLFDSWSLPCGLDFCFWPSCWVSTQWLSSSKWLARGGRHFRCVHFCALNSQCLPKTVMSVMICWAIGLMIASSFNWMRGICLGSIFFALIAPVQPPGSRAPGLDSSTVAHRFCTISTHDHFHTLLPNALYSLAPALWH